MENSTKSEYQVLGVEGEVVEIDGKEYVGRQEETISLTEKQAEEGLAESKIVAVEVSEDEPAEEAPAEEEETPAEEEAPAEEKNEDAPKEED